MLHAANLSSHFSYQDSTNTLCAATMLLREQVNTTMLLLTSCSLQHNHTLKIELCQKGPHARSVVQSVCANVLFIPKIQDPSPSNARTGKQCYAVNWQQPSPCHTHRFKSYAQKSHPPAHWALNIEPQTNFSLRLLPDVACWIFFPGRLDFASLTRMLSALIKSGARSTV